MTQASPVFRLTTAEDSLACSVVPKRHVLLRSPSAPKPKSPLLAGRATDDDPPGTWKGKHAQVANERLRPPNLLDRYPAAKNSMARGSSAY